MQATQKLYWETPRADEFTSGEIVASEFQKKPSIVLPRTLFFPEGGGQLGDRGSLSFSGENIAVVDVQTTDDGVIHHLVEKIPSSLGAEAHGKILRERRDDFTQQHTAQHALSRALFDIGNARTVSARLGSDSATIDIDVPGIADGVLGRACDLVNDVVFRNVPVRTHFPTPEELAKMPLRKDPTVTTGGIRILEIEGFDLTPCGGTHVDRTGEIGTVSIIATEKYKGMIRVTFLAGKRAISDARKKHATLTELAQKLTCGPFDVLAQISKMKESAAQTRAELTRVQGELASLVADSVRPKDVDASGTTVLHVQREKEDIAFVRSLAKRLASRADIVAIVTTSLEDAPNEIAFVVECGESASFDAGAFAKNLNARFGGRGGGRGSRAEGRAGIAALAFLAEPGGARTLALSAATRGASQT